MEREIYVDILVFLNTVINFFLLLITACIAGREKKTGRILAAAFFGGVYALILLLPQLGGPVLTLTRAAMAAAMTAIAFPFRSLRTFLFQWGLLYLAGFLFAGLMVAVWIVFSPPSMLYGNGVVYFHIPALALVLGVLVIYGLVWLFTRRRQSQWEEGALEKVRMGIGGGQVDLWGAVDTGNRLSDPFSGLPVVICRYQSVKQLLPPAFVTYFQQPSPDRMEKAAMDGIRFIPYEAIGKTGLLPVLRPDFLTIQKGGRYQQVEQVEAAIADQDFFDPGCGILLHPGLQRLESPQKSFQKKGDWYGKDRKEKSDGAAGTALGRKKGDFLHKRAGKPPRAVDQRGGSTGLSKAAGGSRSPGHADCP